MLPWTYASIITPPQLILSFIFRDYPGDAGIPMRPVKLANGGAQDHRSR